jgi:hypothetical protein
MLSKKKTDGWHYAFLQDRVLTMSGQKQIYGTQFDVDSNGKVSSMPIKDSENVDKLRTEMGLEKISERMKVIQKKENLIRTNRENNAYRRHRQ